MTEHKSIGKELRERFKPPRNSEQSNLISEVVSGITITNLEETITNDVEAMIHKGYRQALDGYILCLSHIVSHDKAWEAINKAFIQCNEKVPHKYFKQFGKSEDDSVPITTRMKVT